MQMNWLTEEEFEELVVQALDDIPDALWQRIDNVAIEIEATPSAEQMAASGIASGRLLLGLYEGVPLTGRSQGYGLIAPDKVTIFRNSILRVCPRGNAEAVRDQVRRTVLHELAHHFGISDERLEEIGAY